MESGIVWFIISLVALVPYLVLGLPILYFGRRLVCWTVYDYLVPLLPFVIWWGLVLTESRSKSLANLEEIFILGLILLLSPVSRLIIGKRVHAVALSAGLLWFLCSCAFALYYLVPPLPE